MGEPIWVDAELLAELHEDIIIKTGGAPRVRSADLLASAVQRPVNRFHYEGVADLVELAATYAVAVSSNHPFIDGNKRAAFLCLGLFLEDNGLELHAAFDDATQIMLGVAAGETGIEALVEWLRPKVRVVA
jgi:death on curing protein